MKTLLWPALFSLAILGLLAHAGLRLSEPSAAPAPPDSAALSRIDERLERLERSLERLAELEREVARLAAREAPAAEASLPTSPPPETAPAEDLVGDADPAEAPSKLERWLDSNGMREEMEVFVARVYEQARNARMDREREEASARQREMEELSQGPYGKHNYRVNLLAKRLDLNARQMEHLFTLLSQNDERMSGLRREREQAAAEGAQSNPEQLEQQLQHFVQMSKALREGLENDFAAGLSAEQQEAYKGLPPEERVAGAGGEKMVFFQRGVDVMAVPRLKLEAPAAVPAPAGR